MADEQGKLSKRKQSLLVELESIKRFLDDESDTIPVLEEAVIEDEHGNYTPATEPLAPGVLPGQQSLFAPTKKDPTSGQKANRDLKTNTLEQNPFLPEHVRQRLEERANTSSTSYTSSISDEAGYTERLIDQLVARHLPRIEAELRKKLREVAKASTKPSVQAVTRTNKPSKKSL